MINLADQNLTCTRITDENEIGMHRFFDSSPISPSSKLIAYTRFPFDHRLPVPGDKAQVIVREIASRKIVFMQDTTAWDTQLGAQAQWGQDDSELYFNQCDQELTKAFGVKADIFSGAQKNLDGQIYAVSTDGKYAASCKLEVMGQVQAGYGVHVKNVKFVQNINDLSHQGVSLTDLHSGHSRIVLSFADIISEKPEIFETLCQGEGSLYGFHVKFSPDNSRIMLILRWLKSGSRKSKNYLLTFNLDGEDIRIAVDAEDWGHGHHPNWCPDSKSIIMNVSINNSELRFPFLDRAISKACRTFGIRYHTRAYDLRLAIFGLDGENLRLLSKNNYGSGHPTVHPTGLFALTDAYPGERVSSKSGMVPIRVFNTIEDRCSTVLTLKVHPNFYGPNKEWRIDPHPAWSRCGKFLTINAADHGNRGVFVINFDKFLHAYS